jgi:hypothetical protein
MFDPKKLQSVTKKMNRKEQNFDLSYNSEKKTFRISDKFFTENQLSLKGLSISVYEDGSVILSVQSEENSSFFKKKSGAESKTRNFKHPVLSDMLEERGVTSGDIKLVLVGETEDATFYSFPDSSNRMILGVNEDEDSDIAQNDDEDSEEEEEKVIDHVSTEGNTLEDFDDETL